MYVYGRDAIVAALSRRHIKDGNSRKSSYLLRRDLTFRSYKFIALAVDIDDLDVGIAFE